SKMRRAVQCSAFSSPNSVTFFYLHLQFLRTHPSNILFLWLPPDGGLIVEEVQEDQEQLESISRRLIMREEQLFGQDSHSEEDEDQLHKDLEALWLQIQMAVHNTFTSSTGDLEVLRSAVASIQQQEKQDQRWAGCPEDQVPVWRPQKCLRNHNILLQKVVQSRLKKAVEELADETNGLSSALKKEDGKRPEGDLLTVERTVKDCYPPEMDILNVYAGLYQHSFSTRLKDLAGSGVDVKDCSYLLFWTNHYYPKVEMWLQTALKKEEEMWLSGGEPEFIDTYCFSPLADNVICFSYRKAVEDFVKGDHGNVSSVIKAQLVCEEQLRYARHPFTCSCLDCGYSCLTCPFHSQKKQYCSQLWTPAWLDGSLPVIDCLLDSVNLRDLKNLKLTCRQVTPSTFPSIFLLISALLVLQGCTDSSWLTQVLNSVAEILHLQDPGSVHLEMISLSRSFPDLSEAHMSALLLLKTGLSAADVRSIKASVQENRPLDFSTNQSPAFFSKVKVKSMKSMSNKIVQILKS
uniref:Uncharacterized protein n=1 Tax=Sphaeramia orbicularis TaxID=375764 RepID=A0A672ZU13_9TELE